MRHAVEDPPDDLVLVRHGLNFELTQAFRDTTEDIAAKVP
jgi:hypothetical protein